MAAVFVDGSSNSGGGGNITYLLIGGNIIYLFMHPRRRLAGDCAIVMPAEAPTLLVDDHRTLVYATARGEHQGGHAEPLDAVDSALRGSNNTTIIAAVGSSGNRTARLGALAPCAINDGEITAQPHHDQR